MSIRIIYGRAGIGKTRVCLQEIKTAIKAGTQKPLIMLVPEQFTLQAEKDLVATLETGGILATEVLSFRRLAYRIFSHAGGIVYPHVHPAGKSMILCRILDKSRENLKVFSRASGRQGFVSTISSLITELKQYNIKPGDINTALDMLPGDSTIREKLKELNTVFEMYEEALYQRYRDADEDLAAAAKKLGSISIYDGAEVWIDGFSSFTPQEYLLLQSLMEKAGRISITLCCDGPYAAMHGNDAFLTVKKCFGELIRLAQESSIPVEPHIKLDKKPLYRFSGSPGLAHLEKNLNIYPFKVFNGNTPDISLCSSANIYSEIEAAASDIIRLCRDRGWRFKDIALVTGNLAGYEKLIEVVFKEYGIPCFIDRKVDIDGHPLVRMISAMLDIFTDNWSYEAVFRYLKTGLTGIEKERIDRLENYVLACGIRGNRWTDEKKWDMNPGLFPDGKNTEDFINNLEEVNEIRKLIIKPLLDFRNKTRGRRTAADFCGSLYDFLCDTGVPDRITKIAEEFERHKELSLAHEYAKVFNTVMEVFDQAVEVMGDESFGIERFSSIIKTGLGEYKLGLLPASLDQVLVGSIERSKNHEIKALYILGANDGIFPLPLPEEGILSDRDRMLLKDAGIELAKDTRAQAFDSPYLVYRIMTAASQYLRISWPVADQEGRALRPSIIISRIKRLFPDIVERSDILPPKSLQEEMDRITAGSAVFTQMASILRKRGGDGRLLPFWIEVYRWFCMQQEWKSGIKALKASYSYRNIPGIVSQRNISALYGEPAVYSVSRLEKYRNCPFAFYMEYGLGAKERKMHSFSLPDAGTFIHAVIERFSIEVSRMEAASGWRSFDRQWCNEKVSKIMDDMLDIMKGSAVWSSKRYRILALRLKRVISASVWLIAQHIRSSSFEPVEYEAGFGENDRYPPVTIETESGKKIQLMGRIDRVDVLKTDEGLYIRIIDYKSGSKDFRLSDIYYGLSLQLITYLEALWESNNNETNVIPAAMLYFKTDDPIIRGNTRLLEEEAEKALMKQLRMRGLLLADVKIIKEMDRNIEGASLIIPASLNKGGELGRNSSAATKEQFEMLRKYVRKLLAGISSEIMKGDVSIMPYKKKGTTACSYCSFHPVCRFEPSLRENEYQMLFDIKDEDIWKLIGQKEDDT